MASGLGQDGGRSVTHVAITPAKNEAENLPRLARSLAEQTAPLSAWIVVDNGSTDDTVAVVEALARDYPWIRLVHVEGEGQSARGRMSVRAFNAGYDLVEQPIDVVSNVDADVSLPPTYFESLLGRLCRRPDDRDRCGPLLRGDGRLLAPGSRHGTVPARGAAHLPTRVFRADPSVRGACRLGQRRVRARQRQRLEHAAGRQPAVPTPSTDRRPGPKPTVGMEARGRDGVLHVVSPGVPRRQDALSSGPRSCRYRAHRGLRSRRVAARAAAPRRALPEFRPLAPASP